MNGKKVESYELGVLNKPRQKRLYMFILKNPFYDQFKFSSQNGFHYFYILKIIWINILYTMIMKRGSKVNRELSSEQKILHFAKHGTFVFLSSQILYLFAKHTDPKLHPYSTSKIKRQKKGEYKTYSFPSIWI
jgi:hypothetical protein